MKPQHRNQHGNREEYARMPKVKLARTPKEKRARDKLRLWEIVEEYNS